MGFCINLVNAVYYFFFPKMEQQEPTYAPKILNSINFEITPKSYPDEVKGEHVIIRVHPFQPPIEIKKILTHFFDSLSNNNDSNVQDTVAGVIKLIPNTTTSTSTSKVETIENIGNIGEGIFIQKSEYIPYYFNGYIIAAIILIAISIFCLIFTFMRKKNAMKRIKTTTGHYNVTQRKKGINDCDINNEKLHSLP
ncbi:uncharacterized protein LOC143192452 [Rhynchophorus ferrugineus]|uniref:uncharacterized protein LOC143192452 n=1 Tax=Rhynchophorus ferrugineus TaxID=354439 RepID=UPI003FCD0726